MSSAAIMVIMWPLARISINRHRGVVTMVIILTCVTSLGSELSQPNPLDCHIRVCGTRLFKIHVGIILMEKEYLPIPSRD